MIENPPDSAVPAGVYLHFPFCVSHCSYCDFRTVIGQDGLIDRYLVALASEIDHWQPELCSPVDSVFIGGGTPSRMTSTQLSSLLATVRGRFQLGADSEITLECNPESLCAEKLDGYASAGVTRLSIGIQTLDEHVLKSVGRAHDIPTARQAVTMAQQHGAFEINVDLIAGLPGERLDRWEQTVIEVAAMQTDHVSIYLLETENDAPLSRRIKSGRVVVADDDELAQAYQQTVQTFEREGLQLYEICNFARAGRRCRHNVKYWSDGWFAGFGLGAHAYFAGRRRANHGSLERYLASHVAQEDPLEWQDDWDGRLRLEEAMICGLRLVTGIDLVALGRRYNTDLEAEFRYLWVSSEDSGLIEREGTSVRLTPRGRLLSNTVFREIISSENTEGIAR